ncbi:host cell division inhibitor Icd-like protein [Providencia huaxiensis]|uniref:host cell division inhibitor Icd-like protein n=1 Tax=Providencia huaxiensis TaxID=2027290 RepID=UPI003F7DDDCE
MTAINLQMFGTPKAVYQSSNINQLSPELGNIAYQVNDSLLAGNNVSSTYTLNNTVALNYGITGNQSDKLSSGYSVNILAQQSAKTLADVSAKIYANQSPKFTGYQSGEYFLGQSAKHFANLKRGEFTPFTKGDFSHLSKVGKSRSLNSFTSKNEEIEFLQSIKKGKIELLDTIKKERIEFLESIKKGSQSATLGNVDIEYRASENINISLLLWYGKYQFLGLTPNLSSSLRQAVLTHELNGSLPITESICLSKSSSNRIVLLVLFARSYGFLSFSSCIGSNHYDSLYVYGANQYKGKCYIKTMPRSGGTLTGHLITTDNEAIEVTMSKHNTPVTGRTSLTPNQSYRWLFLALNRSDYTAKPCRIVVTASNENSARLMLVRDYMLIFAGRLPAIVSMAV